jgi:hypothetical protein
MADYPASGAPAAVPGDPRLDPSTKSKDYRAMEGGWTKISDIVAGAEVIKAKRTTYLPQYSRESSAAYSVRLASAPWRPEFTDALDNLCSKPFTKKVKVNSDAPDEIQGTPVEEEGTSEPLPEPLPGAPPAKKPVPKKREGGFVDDVDGTGNSLHDFARETFKKGIAYGLEAIYVTYPADVPERATVAVEKKIGARPYWVHVRGDAIVQCLFKTVAGRTVISHIRFLECEVVKDGFAEATIDRVRVLELDALDQPTWQTWTKRADGKYYMDAQPVLLKGVSEIPVALFFTGERSGTYYVKSPMLDLANMQIELYHSLSRKDRILTLAGSPMLVGNGMAPPKPTDENVTAEGTDYYVENEKAPQVEVGPGVVLFAPPKAEGVQSSWDYIAPPAANIKEVREDVNDTMEDFRRLAKQPTTSKSGTMTATGAAIEGAKSHSAVEVWANGLKDVLDQAMKYTAEWMKISDTVSVEVHTDFGVDINGTEEMKIIGAMEGRGVLSPETERSEAARRGILSPSFDEDEEVRKIAEHQANSMLDGEEQIDPKTGLLIPPKKPVTVPPKKPVAAPATMQ